MLSASERACSDLSRPSKPTKYEGKLNELLDNLSGIDLSGDIFDESTYVHGHGGYGDVFTGKSRRHGNIIVAVKRLRFHILPENRDGAKLLLRELSIWSSIHHSNVLPLLGYVMQGPRPGLVSRWMAKGSVRGFMNANPDKPMAHLAKGISSGLLYLHDQDIIHSDLKCDNILLSDFDEPLLADFGISRCLTSVSISNTLASPAGSARWMAKEFFAFGSDETEAIVEHSKETDVWAFGMVLYELLSGLVPFSHLKTDVQVSFALLRGLTPARPNSVCKQEDQLRLWSISQDCWREIPSERPGMRTIYKKLHGSNVYHCTMDLSNQYMTLSSTTGLVRPQVVLGPKLVKASLHPVLRIGPYRYIKYDLRLPLGYSEIYPPWYSEPACIPVREVLFVKARFACHIGYLCPGETIIKIVPNYSSPFVLVRDVLTTLHEAFNTSPDRNVWDRVEEHNPVLRKAIVEAYEKRYLMQAILGNGDVEAAKQKGLVCLDWFGPRTFFGGLSPLKDEGGTPNEVWELVLENQRFF